MKDFTPFGSFAAHLLDLVSDSSGIIRETLRTYGDAPLSELLRPMQCEPIAALQPQDDLWNVITAHAREYYGSALAREAVAELRADPILPTSNHFGLDTLADSVQGTLLFGLRRMQNTSHRKTVTVLGCSTVSIDNLTYPMGLLLYDLGNRPGRFPQRLPVLPNSFRRRVVCSVAPFDEKMVRRAQTHVRKKRLSGDITAATERVANHVLENRFASREILSLPTYGHQASRLNGMLWSDMFHGATRAPQLVQLDLEAVCTDLLTKDLFDPASLISRLYFSTRIRDALITGLDGARACWRRPNLDRRLHSGAVEAAGSDGTIFFWGLEESGARFSLTLESTRSSASLSGIDKRGRRCDFPLTAGGIALALKNRQLIPSLFTCYTVLAFARGLVCVGGHYQAEYLPAMQHGVVEVLRNDDSEAAELIALVPTRYCLAMLQFVMQVLQGGIGIPVGPVQIAGAGGLTDSDLDRVQAVTVREAHLAAFPDLLRYLVSNAHLPDDWVELIGAENMANCPNVVRLPTV